MRRRDRWGQLCRRLVPSQAAQPPDYESVGPTSNLPEFAFPPSGLVSWARTASGPTAATPHETPPECTTAGALILRRDAVALVAQNLYVRDSFSSKRLVMPMVQLEPVRIPTPLARTSGDPQAFFAQSCKPLAPQHLCMDVVPLSARGPPPLLDQLLGASGGVCVFASSAARARASLGRSFGGPSNRPH